MRRAPQSFGWPIAIACGLLWGVAVTLADTLTQPIGALGMREWAIFAAGLLWQWTVTGLIWAVGLKLARGRWKPAILALLLPAALLVSIASQWINPGVAHPGNNISNPMVGLIPLTDLAAYLLWMNLFYGGLYAAGYIVTRRNARQRERLAQFRLARGEADTMLREARLNAYRGQLQPAMLLSALAALQRRYTEDPVDGDALLEQLIAFLRAAMPSVRSGFSTLAAELETVRSYASLRCSVGAPGAVWKLDLPAVVPSIPFPSLLLLPAIDAMSAILADTATLALTVIDGTDGLLIRLEADRPISLPMVIEKRLRGGLALTFGYAATISEGSELPIEVRVKPFPVDSGSNDQTTGGKDEDLASFGRGGDASAAVVPR